MQIDNGRRELPIRGSVAAINILASGASHDNASNIAGLLRTNHGASGSGIVSSGKLASRVGGAPIELTLPLALKGHSVLVENHTEDGCV